MPALWFCLVALQGASNRIFVGRGFSRDIQEPFRMRAALAPGLKSQFGRSHSGRRSHLNPIEEALMPALWFCLVALMLAVYVLLDGFDLGVGIVHLGVAHTDAERRAVIGSIAPVWDGNEVWLITAAGGTLFFAFPVLYASSFSGFYVPLMMVLWLLILRGISVEFRSQHRRWRMAALLGSDLLPLERAAGDFLWRRARQRCAWGPPRCTGLFLRAAVD